MATVAIEYKQPSPAMANHLSFFYHFRQTEPVFEFADRASLAQFRFVLQGTGRCRFIDGVQQVMPNIYVQGPTSGVMTVTGEGHVECVGVGLLPMGWAALVPMDASAVANRLIDARDLFGDVVDEAYIILQNTDDFDTRIRLIEALIAKISAANCRSYHKVVIQVNDWLTDAAAPDVAILVERTGLSCGQLVRTCKRYFGAPPKLLARKYRALRTAVAIAHHDADLDDLLAEGFYDQSHLIREIKYFTGMTPGSLEKHPTIFNQQIAKRIELERQHPMKRDMIIT